MTIWRVGEWTWYDEEFKEIVVFFELRRGLGPKGITCPVSGWMFLPRQQGVEMMTTDGK